MTFTMQFLVKSLKQFLLPIQEQKKKLKVFPAWSKFVVNLIYWIALGSASNAYCLLKYIPIIL